MAKREVDQETNLETICRNVEELIKPGNYTKISERKCSDHGGTGVSVNGHFYWDTYSIKLSTKMVRALSEQYQEGPCPKISLGLGHGSKTTYDCYDRYLGTSTVHKYKGIWLSVDGNIEFHFQEDKYGTEISRLYDLVKKRFEQLEYNRIMNKQRKLRKTAEPILKKLQTERK